MNDPQTLTAFTGVIDTTDQDTEVAITLAELAAQRDEADPDSMVTAFVVQAVSSGTLKLGADTGSASAFVASSNDVIEATTKAYWIPAAGATLASGVVVQVTSPGVPDPDTIVVRIPDSFETAPGSLFARLKATEN